LICEGRGALTLPVSFSRRFPLLCSALRPQRRPGFFSYGCKWSCFWKAWRQQIWLRLFGAISQPDKSRPGLSLRYGFKFCDREDSPLSSRRDESHRRPVRRRANFSSKSGSVDDMSSRSQMMLPNSSLVQFVEALAIADARRDHLAFDPPPPEQEAADGTRTSLAGASKNDARRRLCKIFD
jgi:hypothetical protein